MYNSFEAVSPDLVNNGYCVYAFNYGQTIPLSGFYAMGDIPSSASQLAAEVSHVLAATGASQVDLVGWSQDMINALGPDRPGFQPACAAVGPIIGNV
jgi:triacylglycerol esterase/lipase EstA (alpha/beta hydrolase family)